jgi:uncharacterized protein
MGTCFKNYHRMTLADKAIVEKYLKLANYPLSRYNFLSLWMYSNWMPVYIYDTGKYLLITTYFKGDYFALMPLCDPNDFQDALNDTIDAYECVNLPLVFVGVTKERAALIHQRLPELKVISHRDYFDYVYLAERFRTFGGKRLQKKRNHLNAFYQLYPDFEMQLINESNLTLVEAFMRNWFKEHSGQFLDYDEAANLLVLDHYLELGLTGYCMIIDGAVQGYIIATNLGTDGVQINIEKANDRDYRGIYQALLKEFLNREFLDARVMNREDDIGLENLRKAKLAYHPDELLENYQIGG